MSENKSLRRQHTIRHNFYESQKKAKLNMLRDVFILDDTIFKRIRMISTKFKAVVISKGVRWGESS